MGKKGRKQTVDDIDVLEGLEPIRLKPGMYVTALKEEGVFQILKEVTDNVRDEFAAHRATSLYVTIEDGTYVVVDDGGGFPLEIHKKTKLPAIETILSKLHAGGKLHKEKSTAYTGSVGTFGIGAKATNALSTLFEVWTYRSKAWHYIAFKKGKLSTPLEKVKSKTLKVNGKTIKKGTIIKFKPDKSILKATTFPKKVLHDWALITSYLNPKFKITIDLGGKEGEVEYKSKDGLKEYAKSIADNTYKGVQSGSKFITFEDTTTAFSLVFATGCEGEQVMCYTNTSPNKDGGYHLDMIKDNMFQALKQHETKKDSWRKEDFTDGMTGVINTTIDSPEFSSQTKSELTDDRVFLADDEIWEFFKAFFNDNKKFAKQLIARACAIRDSKDEFRSNKALASVLKGKRGKQSAPSALARADRKTKPEDIELFIVEGESAGGSAKRARIRSYQSVLPSKGKPANITNLSADKLKTSEEIVKALQSIGVGSSKGKLSVGKIILLSDGDPDGKHIDALWLSVLAKMVPQAFSVGGVFTVEAPLRYAKYKGTYVYGNTTDEVRKKLPKGVPAGIKIGYIKGYGEISYDLLHDIAFNPETRVLHRVSLDKVDAGLMLMSSTSAQEKLKLLL